MLGQEFRQQPTFVSVGTQENLKSQFWITTNDLQTQMSSTSHLWGKLPTRASGDYQQHTSQIQTALNRFEVELTLNHNAQRAAQNTYSEPNQVNDSETNTDWTLNNLGLGTLIPTPATGHLSVSAIPHPQTQVNHSSSSTVILHLMKNENLSGPVPFKLCVQGSTVHRHSP